jgi:hypothetical protein
MKRFNLPWIIVFLLKRSLLVAASKTQTVAPIHWTLACFFGSMRRRAAGKE